MYKDRIRKWGLEKNIKSVEMKAIIRKQAQRLLVGKRSAFRLRGVEVPEHKIMRFRKTAQLLCEASLEAATPPALICYTPLPSPLSTPSELAAPERLTKLFQSFIFGSISSKNCTSPISNGDRTCDFIAKCKLAFDLSTTCKSQYTWQVFNLASACIEPMITVDCPLVLEGIFYFLAEQCQRGDLHIVRSAFLRQFLAMSSKVKPANHPFNHVFQILLESDSDQLKHELDLLHRVQADTFAQSLGPCNPSTIHTRLLAIRFSSEVHHLDSTRSYLTLLREAEDALGEAHTQCLQVRLHLAEVYYIRFDYQNAAQMIQDIITLSVQNQLLPPAFASEVFFLLAKVHIGLSETDQAVIFLHQAIVNQAHYYGYEDEGTLEYMASLELILVGAGRDEDAAEVRRRQEESLNSKHARLIVEEEQRWASYQASQSSAW
ncbi:MAG: hypothetical protein Q9166_002093 [cf. Caloplaca sp. 2 TL-2023]